MIIISTKIFAETIPQKLLGIWEAKDRYVFFEQNDENQPEIVVVLKEYYGWYYDRAVEPEKYSQKEERTRNLATPKSAEHIFIQNIKTKETSNSIYGSLDLSFSRRDKNTIPFFINDDELYLSFFEKDARESSFETGSLQSEVSSTYSFYRGVAPSKGFMISPQAIPENITGFIIDKEKLYDVRYWKTDMDYSTDYITFSYNEDSYQIPKHIKSGETNYSCVSGRSKKVRNPVKAFEYKDDDFIFNDERSVFTKKTEPYLKRLAGRETFEELIKIVKEANSRRKPDPPALFPESNLDWHWDLIDLLEKENELIQQVRMRQKNFGPRGKEIGR